MAGWNELSVDLKMCVVIYKENQAGRKVWMSRLVELLKNDADRMTVSKNEDRLYDLGIINMGYERVDGKWTNCLSLGPEANGFVKNVAENLTGYPLNGSDE